MKETGIKTTVTYAKVVPCDCSKARIQQLASILNITNAVAANDLHATVVCSRTPVPGLEDITVADIIHAVPIRFDLFDSDGYKCLVIRLHSLQLQQLHKKTRDMGASYDYDAYHPHITLSYDFQGPIPADDVLTTIGGIHFTEFKIEPFDSNYGNQNGV